MVVDLAVEDQPQRAIFVAHRLVTCGAEVENGQAAEAERDAALQVLTVIVGAAVHQRAVHCSDVARQFTWRRPRAHHNAVDAAHLGCYLF